MYRFTSHSAVNQSGSEGEGAEDASSIQSFFRSLQQYFSTDLTTSQGSTAKQTMELGIDGPWLLCRCSINIHTVALSVPKIFVFLYVTRASG